MKISKRTVEHLKQFVTGDNKLTPYRSGPVLVRLFNGYGSDDEYPMGGGFPSRHVYAETKLLALNDTPELARLIEEVFDPLQFEGTDLSVHQAIDGINPFLERDGFRLTVSSRGAQVITSAGDTYEFDPPAEALDPSSIEFAFENADKCRRKLRDGDFKGAITNARSLLEDVLVGVERRLDPDSSVGHDGDLPKLFKRVRKLLSMEAKEHSADRDLFVALNGLTGLVDGLAGFSNRAGDRHGGGVQPAPHHAAFIVSSAIALAGFVTESAALQIRKKGSGQ